ncbi:hypothetical protein M2459_003639 [Parabacteroides sp. PF5-5]|uniref:hypothetical protein n=1 Tax=unclassified Parabacteroides TaxID=2649774 RepID=UPI002475F0E6|nr:MULTISPECIES: hypothetical protein [unclassified Parabacteroides]MDH6306699.1 hypothetical protein [Parabacteroides sp. PH5-39]MDH6316230.1 hypothetical protein [Parabacteroides sp. PF5-13]MDH6321449.1 hypothetical protein [Parabacteroides sp. PH5-13]MDH6325180.1 hypothetical protein [Parabacteroides sp. PH5-8]MDH6329062.1 hypothetical protein [Parabacteroides sp. PH5-41]
MKTLKQSIYLIPICLILLSSCSGETVGVEKEKEETTELKFHADLIGLWESDVFNWNNKPGGSKSTTQYMQQKLKVTMLISNTEIAISKEYGSRMVYDDEGIGEIRSYGEDSTNVFTKSDWTISTISQKCELVEVNYPYYTIKIVLGQNLGKNMVFKFIPEKGTIEWEAYLSDGDLDKVETMKKVN